MRVAIIEDEPRLRSALARGFEQESYLVDGFPNAAEAREKIQYSGALYDLILLDLMLPDGDGAEVCTHLRNTGVTSPIIVLTARDSLEDKVTLFERGADDFISKPFQFEELLARGRALQRRSSGVPHTLSVGACVITPAERSVKVGAKQLTLTPREFELLLYLASERGRVVPREELILKVWKQEDPGQGTNIIDVHMRNLRKKLGSHADLIQTIHGVGYTIA